MSSVNTLESLYLHELAHLWSANEQMAALVRKMADDAQDLRLADGLQQSAAEITRHTRTIRRLLDGSGSKVAMERCRGMEGLVQEAMSQLSEAPGIGQILDLVMIANYKRTMHYALAGCSMAASYSKALGLEDDHAQLDKISSDIYAADFYADEFAEHAEQAATLGTPARA